MHHYTFLVYSQGRYRNPVTKTQLYFSAVPCLNTVAGINTTLTRNRMSNTKMEEACSPEMLHTPWDCFWGKLLSTGNEPAVDTGKAGVAWGSSLLKGCRWEGESESHSLLCLCSGSFFSLLPHFWAQLTCHGAETAHCLFLPPWPRSRKLCIALEIQAHFMHSWKWTQQKGRWWMTNFSWQMWAIKKIMMW